MSFMQGEPLPDVTVTRTTEEEAPSYYTDYLEGLSSAGQTALGIPGGELVAGMDPLQTQGYGALPDAATAYGNLFGRAQTAAEGFGGITPQDISAFMDPYQQNVVDELGRLSALNVQRNVLPQLKAGFVGSGGLGGQRYAGALGQSLADIQLGLQGQQAGLLSKGYQDAVANAFRQAQEERQAATTQADLGQLAQELGLKGVGALVEGGAQRQAYEQSKIEAPLQQAINAAQLMRGYQIPLFTEEIEKGPKPGAYGTSTFQDIGSILGLIGAYGGNAPKGASGIQIAGYGAKDVVDFLKDLDLNFDFGGSGVSPISESELNDIIDAGN